MKRATKKHVSVPLLLCLCALLLTACARNLGQSIPEVAPAGSLNNTLPAAGQPATVDNAYPIVADPATLDTAAGEGQAIEMPTAVPEAAPAEAAAPTEVPPAPTPEPQPVVEQPAAEQPAPTGEQATAIHIVQDGETIGAIADRYGVTIDDILASNDIFNVNQISIGQELQIVPGAALEAANNAAANAAVGGVGFDPNNYFIHIVGFGDTLFVIAQRYGFTVEELANYNGIADINRIDLNQEVRIPIR